MKIFILLFSCSLFAKENFKQFNQPIAGKLPHFTKEDISPIWKISNQHEKQLLKLDNHQMKNQEGNDFGTKQMKGKISVVNFFFATCPGYCPTMTRTMKTAFLPFKNNPDINFISYSVTPGIDDQKKLKSYAHRYGINNSNWHLLRGTRETVYRIAREQLLSDLAIDLNKPKEQFVHSESVYLIDQDLYVRGIYNGTVKNDMLKLKRDMTHLKKEMGQFVTINR